MIDKIINKINSKADNFEEVRQVALEITTEINKKSKYPVEIIEEKPNLIIQIKDLGVFIKIQPEQMKDYTSRHGMTVRDEILNILKSNVK
ncbi:MULTISPECIES: hypothetical protein [unclassified Clostridium]|uniref:hypothetical protein n=1 Tax=unclassified Clostridium TaxID=2614128 RepID=UPI00029842DF|nr:MULTISPECIES: hypothetical protein [unclassified Clostridium]EKQ54467.1 MAG: hypothetical protein A370_03292 [Clostridium sp. Maddingley MBC34-26]